MTNNESFVEAMRRLDLLSQELAKIKRAVQATADGTPFNEAYNEEIFMEGYDTTTCRKLSKKLVRHFLEMKYSSSHDPNAHWEGEIREFRDALATEIDWYLFKKKKGKQKGHKADSASILYMRNNLQTFYEGGVVEYERLRDNTIKNKKILTLPDISKIVPEECPWTLEQFLDAPVEEVMNLLPDLK